MKKIILAGLLAFFPLICFSFDISELIQKPNITLTKNTDELATFFQNKNGCFILYDLTKKELISEYNSTRCEERIPADSTFKIPLSVMAFDQKMIDQNSVFIWDKKDRGIDVWNNDQTPQTWMTYSTVWVSQLLTPKLGLHTIKNYLRKFNYGNQDFSGGIKQAWLNNSLKISAKEELEFLLALDQYRLPVSKTAIDSTLRNLYLETSPNGWKLYAKTGTGDSAHTPTNIKLRKEDGWFVGYVTKTKHTYVFVLNFSDLKRPQTSEAGGLRAKEIAKKILQQFEVF